MDLRKTFLTTEGDVLGETLQVLKYQTYGKYACAPIVNFLNELLTPKAGGLRQCDPAL